MKFIHIFTLLLAAAVSVQGDLPFLNDDDWFMLVSHAGGGNTCGGDDQALFCARTENGKQTSGTHVVMGDECPWDETSGWRIQTAKDGNGVLLMLGNENGYSGDKDALCMQAGDGDRRSRIRILPCDINHPLQRWVWKDYGEKCKDAGGRIKLQSNKDLCLTWFGYDKVKPNQTRRMITMPCKDLNGMEAKSKGWFAY